MSDPVPHMAADSPLEAALGRLDAVLAPVADALARMPRRDWHLLCKEEWGLTFAAHQCWAVIGLPEAEMIPERVIGHRIIEIFAARYPHLARDDAA
jgi:hypothetical protein